MPAFRETTKPVTHKAHLLHDDGQQQRQPAAEAASNRNEVASKTKQVQAAACLHGDESTPGTETNADTERHRVAGLKRIKWQPE